jgi:predicted ATPase/class 3 adenylate cyclase/DNA-binding CsgD family transcriptional regulator
MQPVDPVADRRQRSRARSVELFGNRIRSSAVRRYGAPVAVAVAPPSGTVTFLFTDVQDSTRLWDESAADMAGAVQVHDAILREAIDRHGGYVFSADGDRFAAAFATPAGAVAAAIDGQRELEADPIVRFTVRMGLHTGEAVERGRNYVGSEVSRTARLMALGHGGQILVSDTTAVLLRDRLTLRSLGEYLLRGPRGRIAVFQVVADGLRTEFPLLRSVDDFAGNLPRQPSSLVGREQLITDVAELVRSNRLVTLCGVGGVGKTRLSIEVGAEVANEFPDGVWIVELAAVGDDPAVAATIATVMGITPDGDVPLLDTVVDALGRRRMVLILDNCEHVVSGVTRVVEAMLGRAGDLTIVATSRERLELAGESVVTVSPLGADGGIASDAATLFVDRARTARPSFEIRDPTDAAAVTEICETVDGLPLGIELAAARMAAMSAVEVRDRLADRFRLLHATVPEPARQLTLRHAVEWSYDLLSENERALLRTIAVFAGGFDLSSIGSVAENDDEIEVLQILDSLVRKSLVIADHSAARTRYGLFETIRQFAADRLADTADADAARDRHAAFFAERAAAHWEHWNGPRWREAVDWVEIELANLRSAFRWASGHGHLEVATDIAAHAALIGFSVQLFETLSWAEGLIEAAAAADVARLPRLYTAAGYACFAGRPDAARHNAHRATELEEAGGYDPCEPGYSMFVEALGQVYCGDLDRYIELTGEVVSRYGSTRGYGLASYVDGLQSAGRIEEALALTEQSVAAARDLGNPYWISYALWIAGMAFSRTDARRALAAWDEGVTFVRGQRVQFFEGFLARDAARMHTSDGEPEAALVLFGDAIAAFQRAGNVPQLVITLASVPALFERLERFHAAATLFGALSRQPSSFHHVPELADLGARVRVRLGEAATELEATGATFDLNDAAVYAGQQIDAARRDPAPQARVARPGGLSRRELEVLRLVAAGRTSHEIAADLFISTRTAEHHIANIYTKIGVSNRAAAAGWAVTHRVVGDAVAG